MYMNDLSSKQGTDSDNNDYSESALLKWVDVNEPIPDGFVRSTPDIVIPMGIKDVFRNFFKNNAPYSFDIAMEAIGIELTERSIWQRPEE